MPPSRLLEPSALVAIRVGEAAAHVSEELRLEQRVGHARAVDRDEWAVRAAAALVNEPRDHFLADAALARDEDLRVRPGRALDLLLDEANGRAAADQLP